MMCFRIDFFGFTLPDISSLALTCSSLFYFAKFGVLSYYSLNILSASLSFFLAFLDSDDTNVCSLVIDLQVSEVL